MGNFILYGVCKLVFLGSPLGHPKGVPCAELSPQVTEGFPATAANRFHKELRFFFSLLKRKKEAKKEKNSPTLVLYGNASHEDYTRNFFPHRFSPTKLPRRGIQAAAAAVTLPFSQLKLGRKVSGDPPRKEKKKQKKKRVRLPLYCTATYHTKITQETFFLTDSHQQISPGGANRRLVRRDTTLFTLKIGA